MRLPVNRLSTSLLLCLSLAACGDTSTIPESETVGERPTLPQPANTLLPTMNIATATSWPAGAKPKAASGLAVAAFAEGLDHPRSLLVLPNGDVLVTETNGPPRPDDSTGIKGWVSQQVQKRAGAGVPSANRITLLRDKDGDGVAETKEVFLSGLNSPFGMLLLGDSLYIANTDALMRYPYTADQTRMDAPGTKVTDLPAGTINHHWTKTIVASADGTKIYVSIGSNSNVGENGLDKEEKRAAVLEVDVATSQTAVFASGLRNAVGLALELQTKTLWAAVNERDELGSDLVPDYLTSVRQGAFYGWPFSYYGQHVDTRVTPPNPLMVAKAIAPDYALGNHVAPLGLAFTQDDRFPAQFRSGAFVGEHGSWNRKPRSGYKVVFIAFQDGKPVGQPVTVLDDFLNQDGEAQGRPVGVAMHPSGALLVADDVGKKVWRVTPQIRATQN